MGILLIEVVTTFAPILDPKSTISLLELSLSLAYAIGFQTCTCGSLTTPKRTSSLTLFLNASLVQVQIFGLIESALAVNTLTRLVLV